MKYRRHFFWLGILAVLFSVNHFLPPVAAATEKEKGSRSLLMNEITVTARKKQENVQDVPMSVSVFSQTDLEDAGAKNMSDLVRFTPNLFLKESSAENVLILRGISSFSSSIYSPVGFYVDGVNFPLHYMYNPELFGLERVEVLRGPQGTLYGRNSESGVVNLVTKQPDNEFRAKLSSEYASYNSWELGMNLSTPVVENQLFLGLAMQYKLSDGYIENRYNSNDNSGEKDRKNGRATLRWTPADQWDISFIADFLDTDDQQNSYRYRTGAYATDSHDISHNTVDEYSRQNGNGQTLRLAYQGDGFDLISVTGLRKYTHEYNTDMDCTDDLGPFNWGGAPSEYDIEHMSQEIRISSPDGNGNFQWLTGVYGFGEETRISSDRKAWGMSADTEIDIKGHAVFGQGTYTVFEKMHLTAGLRFDHQELEGKMRAQSMAGPIYQEKDLDFNEWLPKFSVAYDVSKDVMAYATVSKGYMVGGYNYGYMPSDESAFYYDPEYTWNYEAGIKTAWLDNRIKANLCFFYIDIDDKQVVEWSMAAGTAIKNAAKAHSQGVELEVQALLFPGLQLFAGLGYVESKFDDWKALQTDGSTYDFKGNYVPDVPNFTCNIGAFYIHESGFFGRVDVFSTGSYYGDPQNKTKEEASQITNIRFGYETDHWMLTLWCTNLFDKEYVTALFDNSSMGLGELVQDGEPRMIGATLTYRF